MSEELTIQSSGEFSGGEIDPVMDAIRQAIIDTSAGAMAEFGERQVVVVPPDETDQGIDAKIKTAMGKTGGLCLLLVAGGGKNPDPDSAGPLVTIEMEAQLYVSTRIRGKEARPVMALISAIARTLHHAKVSVNAFELYERLRFTGFDPLPDPDFTAYVLRFDREMQF